MELVNWFDGNNLGLNQEPILSHVKNIYDDFNGRVFIVPVVHVKAPHVTQSINQIQFDEFQSPPWIFINYNNSLLAVNDSDGAPPFTVTGRDDSLLRILARKMNFQFRYIDVQAAIATDNATLPGELGLEMLMRRVIIQSMLNAKLFSSFCRKRIFCSATSL